MSGSPNWMSVEKGGRLQGDVAVIGAQGGAGGRHGGMRHELLPAVGGVFRGLGIETSGEKAIIGVDVRVVSAATAEVLDSVNVRKPIKSGGFSVSGVGAFARKLTKKNLQGADVGVGHEGREGVDEALRACIQEAVYQLVQRYGQN